MKSKQKAEKGKSADGLQNKKVVELRAMIRKERNAGKHPKLTGKDVSFLKKRECLDLLGRKPRRPRKPLNANVPEKESSPAITVAEKVSSAITAQPVADTREYRRRTMIDVITAWADGIDRLKNPWTGSSKLVQVSGRWYEIQYHRVSHETRMVLIGGQGWFGVEPVRESKAPTIEVMAFPRGEPDTSMLEIETGGFGAMIAGR